MTTDTKHDVQPAFGVAVSDVVRDGAAELTALYWHVGKRLARKVLGDERGAYGQQVTGRQCLLSARYRRADEDDPGAPYVGHCPYQRLPLLRGSERTLKPTRHDGRARRKL